MVINQSINFRRNNPVHTTHDRFDKIFCLKSSRIFSSLVLAANSGGITNSCLSMLDKICFLKSWRILSSSLCSCMRPQLDRILFLNSSLFLSISCLSTAASKLFISLSPYPVESSSPIFMKSNPSPMDQESSPGGRLCTKEGSWNTISGSLPKPLRPITVEVVGEREGSLWACDSVNPEEGGPMGLNMSGGGL